MKMLSKKGQNQGSKIPLRRFEVEGVDRPRHEHKLVLCAGLGKGGGEALRFTAGNNLIFRTVDEQDGS